MPDETAPTITVVFDADIAPLEQQLAEAAKLGTRFGNTLSTALVDVSLRGKGLSDTLRSLTLRLSEIALKAAFKPLTDSIGGGLASLFSGGLAFAKGGVVQRAMSVPFASGGIISSPITFPLAGNRLGLAGERGAEAIMPLARGAEERNARWADSRRSYNAGWGVKSLNDLHAVIAFFEERRGRLHGFRWRDPTDFKSCPPESMPTALDQPIGTGDGTTAAFQLAKTYGATLNPWTRAIRKPVAGTILVAVAGTTQMPGTAYTADPATGLVTFLAGHIPGADEAITAGFEFDVPVRFDTDKLEINIQGFRHGAIPSIPIVEIRV